MTKQPSIFRWLKDALVGLKRRPFGLLGVTLFSLLFYCLYPSGSTWQYMPLLALIGFVLLTFLAPYVTIVEMIGARQVADEHRPAKLFLILHTLWEIPGVVGRLASLTLLKGFTLLVGGLVCSGIAFGALFAVDTLGISAIVVFFILLADAIAFYILVRGLWWAPILVEDAKLSPFAAIKASVGIFWRNFFRILVTDFLMLMVWSLPIIITYGLLIAGTGWGSPLTHGSPFYLALGSIVFLIVGYFVLSSFTLLGYLYYRDGYNQTSTHHFPTLKQ